MCVQLLFHIMGVAMGQCRSGEFSGFVKTTKTLSLYAILEGIKSEEKSS